MVSPTKQSLSAHKSKSGEIFVGAGLINASDVDRVLAFQNSHTVQEASPRRRLFGVLLCNLNLITPLDNYFHLARHHKLMSVEDWLLMNTSVSKPMIDSLGASSRKSAPIYDLLLNTGQISMIEIQQCLFDLYHLPFKPLEDFQFSRNQILELSPLIPMIKAYEHQVLPLALHNSTLLIAATRPESLLYIYQHTQETPHYRVKPLFIPFGKFRSLFKALYGEPFYSESVPAVVPLASPEPGKPVDLSLLFSFRTTIRDPIKEETAVTSLYKRYEILRKLTGNPPKNRKILSEFKIFIHQEHTRLMHHHQCRAIEYSVKEENNGVIIVAVPLKPEPVGLP